MAKKLISYDDEAEGLGLPGVVEQRLIEVFAAKGDVPAAATQPQGLDTLSTALDFGALDGLSVGVVADSTMNDGNESARIFSRLFGARLPDNVRSIYNAWNGTSWRETVDQEGVPTNHSGGVVFDDTFSRSGEIVGSTPEVGPAWLGDEGGWVSDGDFVTSLPGSGVVYNIAGDGSNGTTTIDLSLITSKGDLQAAQNLRVYAFGRGRGEGLWVYLSITANGFAHVGLYSTIGGSGTRTLQSSTPLTDLGIVSDSATPQDLTVTLTVDIQNVTLTATTSQGSETWEHLLTEDESGGLGSTVTLMPMTDSPGLRIDRLRVEHPVTEATFTESVVWNGSIAGARFTTFDETKISEMFGDKNIDVLIMSMGHNNGTQKPEDFVDELAEWVKMWRAAHPETKGVVWVSQNPQFPPAASPVPHLKRQKAVRLSAGGTGMEYVPAAEAFLSQPDGGASLVNADGIHPTTPPGSVTEGDYGAVLTAETIMQAITARG